jgi:hypothetical protein
MVTTLVFTAVTYPAFVPVTLTVSLLPTVPAVGL